MYEHDDEAHDEAASHPISSDHLLELAAQVQAKRNQLGVGGVRAHRITYDRDQWSGVLHPSLSNEPGVITRGDVFTLAEKWRRTGRSADLIDIFTACYVWGMGTSGYGPHRLQKIVDTAADGLEEMLQRAATAASTDLIDGYAMLYGGYNSRRRAQPNQEPWVRIKWFGPAFFTKFLYFTTDGALILDRVLARRVASLSGMEYFVRRDGKPFEWSPYRYSVYLHWMRQTAGKLALDCTPEELELTLFAPPSVR